MIKIKTLLVACLATLMIFGCSTSKQVTSEKEPYFIITVEQDGVVVSPINNIVTLKKKPFKFNVLIKEENEGVYVNAAWDDSMYNYSSKKDIFYCLDENIFEDCGFVDGMTMATTTNNTEKSLVVGDFEAQQYWFYKKDENRYMRFDKGAFVEKGMIKATFTVEKIWDRFDEERIDISKINKDIYFTSAVANYDKETKFYSELERIKFIIKFK